MYHFGRKGQDGYIKSDNISMTRKLFKRLTGVIIILNICTIQAVAKGKSDTQISEPLIEISQEISPETITEELDVVEEEAEPVKEPVQLYTLRPVEGKPVSFTETWGYVSQGREDEYDASLPEQSSKQEMHAVIL